MRYGVLQYWASWIGLLGCCTAQVGAQSSPTDRQPAELVAAWPLKSDTAGRNAPDAINHRVSFEKDGPAGAEDGCARFDGVSSYLEIPAETFAKLDPQNFSLSAWIKLDAAARDLPGEIISRYDPAARRGFRLAVDSRTGVTSSQANWRNLHFGFDNGTELSTWTDHGQLGKAVLVFSMAVHAGELFAGTCVAGAEESGHVFRFDGQSWTDCGSPDRANAVTSLAVYEGALYASTGKYRLSGSALTESINPHLGGGIYRYAGDNQWVDCGRLPGVEAIHGMVVYGGKLYASSMYAPAGLYRYEGEQSWTNCGAPDGKRAEALAVYNGFLYATGYDEGAVYRYDGQAWEHMGKIPDATQTYGFAVYRDHLFVSEWPNAKVFRWGGRPGVWQPAGRLGMELETMPLLVYNGKMYGGTLPSAEVYRWDPGLLSEEDVWTQVGTLDATPDVRYRRVWSMAVFQGRLFAGTLPSGRVYSAQAGWNVTWDQGLSDGWHHLAAVVDRGELKLFLNGKLLTDNQRGVSIPRIDLFSGEQPVTIGRGTTDYFCGHMSDVRVYNGSLTTSQLELSSTAK
jgi:hypothetical protein